MHTYILLLLLQILAPPEMNCLGFIQESLLPANVFIAGTNEEGTSALATESDLIVLNGPGISALKAGEIYKVVRPEGRVRDRITNDEIGFYYKELGTIRVNVAGNDYATAMILSSCYHMFKGDLVVPLVPRPNVTFSGKPSNRLTPYPAEGIAGAIILGKDDSQELTAGNICFIGLGAQQGVKVGDRFTIYRTQPPFNRLDLMVDGEDSHKSYEKLVAGKSDKKLPTMLTNRKLPPRVLGDLVIVDVGAKTSTAKIINSISEIHLGDVIVRR